MDGDTRRFFFLKELLPQKDVIGPPLGIGWHDFPMDALSILNGRNARLGFQDNVYISKGVLAKRNGQWVEKRGGWPGSLGQKLVNPAKSADIQNP